MRVPLSLAGLLGKSQLDVQPLAPRLRMPPKSSGLRPL